ncbi:uncharacterized protein ASPGLDRAFT_878368 [Aspergillus glaucus CBS 516.65]|uniref:Uncharacterized protein n=1 Tax=Aspergillus glaucus CBS 516.65 TaxID=1160497 RepID=A0A1L9V8G1_ASPGL|nr:hypothetical protein ASPGLDRAFT_878368 [Aspergillus glaucus CBS 516.65]OJJ80159.1 hypothetical protein ASPGLDRAFT_878368 [Aspergillus glaucus CBS 516.65]
MPGMMGDNQSPEEASDPITPTMQPESMASKARQSASSVAERIAAPLQPGDTTPTTRRMSDTPSTSRAHGEGSGVDVGEGWSDVQAQKQEDKGMLQSAQEMVAKALGGGSRGSS